MLFAESEVDQETLASLSEKERKQIQLYPPASANELEFHILKFYCFSSALVYNVLKVSHFNIFWYLWIAVYSWAQSKYVENGNYANTKCTFQL